jgi:hypothetical protein
VAVDYFTKWVDAGALAKITAANVIKFFNGNVIARFGIPQLVVTENRYHHIFVCSVNHHIFFFYIEWY